MQKQYLPLLAFLALLFVLALFLAGDYGMAWDDQGLWDYADHTIQVYQESLRGSFVDDPGPGNLRYYGPAFLTLERLVERAVPQLDPAAIWQTSIFLTFLVGLASLYSIAVRLFTPQVALGVTVLFASQPLIWGHAFINGKDTPFLGFFLLSVALGLKVESVIPKGYKPKNLARDFSTAMRKDWAKIKPQLHRRLIWISALLAAASLLLIFFPNWPEAWLRATIEFAFANPNSSLGSFFTQFAPNASALPVENYVQKALRIAQVASTAIAMLVWFALFAFTSRFFVETKKRTLQLLRSISTKNFWKSPTVWVAGLALAFATAVRVMAPFAAVLVAIYLIAKKGWSALPVLFPYLLIASVGTFLLWPYLWPNPIGRLWESLTIMSNFPQPSVALFNGEIISVAELPRYFLPQLLLIQLSLPAILLILFGFALYIKNRTALDQKSLSNICLLWLGLPIAYAIIFSPSMYDNFRQWLFILPPLFIFSGFAFEKLAIALRKSSAYWAALFLVALSGILPIVQLHPYEYIYYNALVGGVRGASGRFELDYWATALTEATRQLNGLAPQNSRVVVWGQELIVQNAARSDLLIEGNRGGTFDLETGYNYAIVNLGTTRDEKFLPEHATVITISRLGIALAMVKELNN
jgi:hypothetical protein